MRFDEVSGGDAVMFEPVNADPPEPNEAAKVYLYYKQGSGWKYRVQGGTPQILGQDASVFIDKTLYVSVTGSDVTGDGSLSKPFQSGTAAVAAIPAHANNYSTWAYERYTIYFMSGRHTLDTTLTTRYKRRAIRLIIDGAVLDAAVTHIADIADFPDGSSFSTALMPAPYTSGAPNTTFEILGIGGAIQAANLVQNRIRGRCLYRAEGSTALTVSSPMFWLGSNVRADLGWEYENAVAATISLTCELNGVNLAASDNLGADNLFFNLKANDCQINNTIGPNCNILGLAGCRISGVNRLLDFSGGAATGTIVSTVSTSQTHINDCSFPGSTYNFGQPGAGGILLIDDISLQRLQAQSGVTFTNCTVQPTNRLLRQNRVQDTATTLLLTDKVIVSTPVAPITLILPTAANYKLNTLTIKNRSAFLITADGNGAETIDGAATQPVAAGQSKDFYSDGTTWFVVQSEGSSSVTVPLDLASTPGSADVITISVTGDAGKRLTLDADGTIRFGDGTAAPDAAISRTGVGIVNISTTLSIGTNPATAGDLRLRNTGTIQIRSALASVNKIVLTTDGSDYLRFGQDTTTNYLNFAAPILSLVGYSEFSPTGDGAAYLGQDAATNRWAVIYLRDAVIVGDLPATSGQVRITNAGTVQFRNFADNANVQALSVNASDQVVLGSSGRDLTLGGALATFNATSLTTVQPSITGTISLGTASLKFKDAFFSGAISLGTSVSIGTSPAATGVLRLPNNEPIYWRNASNSADIAGIVVDSPNNIIVLGSGGSNVKIDGGVLNTAQIAPNTDAASSVGSGSFRYTTGHFSTGLELGTAPLGGGGIIKVPNAPSGGIIGARNAANNGNLTVLDVLATDEIVLGNGAHKVQIGNSASALLGFFATTPAVRQAGVENVTNSVASGGTDGTIANYTDLTVYANDAAAIRNNIYQLARGLAHVKNAMRLYGQLS